MINERMRALQPEASTALSRATAVAWEATDPELLELCRCLIARLLDLDIGSRTVSTVEPGPEPQKIAALGDWVNSDIFSPLERAALGFTEQFVLSVSAVSDELVEALRAHLDDEAVYAFAASLYLVDMTERLQAVSSVVLGEEVPA